MKFILSALIGLAASLTCQGTCPSSLPAGQCPSRADQAGYTDKWNMNMLNPGVISGALFLGAMSSTQKDMFGTSTRCFTSALDVQTEFEAVGWDFSASTAANKAQII